MGPAWEPYTPSVQWHLTATTLMEESSRLSLCLDFEPLLPLDKGGHDESLAVRHADERDILVELDRVSNRRAIADVLDLAVGRDVGEDGGERALGGREVALWQDALGSVIVFGIVAHSADTTDDSSRKARAAAHFEVAERVVQDRMPQPALVLHREQRVHLPFVARHHEPARRVSFI